MYGVDLANLEKVLRWCRSVEEPKHTKENKKVSGSEKLGGGGGSKCQTYETVVAGSGGCSENGVSGRGWVRASGGLEVSRWWEGTRAAMCSSVDARSISRCRALTPSTSGYFHYPCSDATCSQYEAAPRVNSTFSRSIREAWRLCASARNACAKKHLARGETIRFRGIRNLVPVES